MSTLTIECANEEQRLIYEQAIAFVTQMHQMAETAVDGTVLEACEQLALEKGRELLQSTLVAAIEHRIRTVEKKGGQRVGVNAAQRGRTRDAIDAGS
jgi:K+-sensing histidine kinase KdpD